MRVTCCKMLCCLPTFCVVHTVNRFDLWISKQYRRLAFKTMYVQFSNETKSCVYWFVNETLWYKIETFDFQSETRSRPSHVSMRLGRDWDVWKLRLETVSRPRSQDRDYIPGLYHGPKLHPGLCSSVGIRLWRDTQTDTHTDVGDHNTFCVIYNSHKM